MITESHDNGTVLYVEFESDGTECAVSVGTLRVSPMEVQIRREGKMKSNISWHVKKNVPMLNIRESDSSGHDRISFKMNEDDVVSLIELAKEHGRLEGESNVGTFERKLFNSFR